MQSRHDQPLRRTQTQTRFHCVCVWRVFGAACTTPPETQQTRCRMPAMRGFPEKLVPWERALPQGSLGNARKTRFPLAHTSARDNLGFSSRLGEAGDSLWMSSVTEVQRALFSG